MEFIKNLLAPPIFPENEDETRVARYYNAISLSTSGILLIVVLLRLINEFSFTGLINQVLAGLIALMLITRYLVKRDILSVKFSSIILVGSAWIGLGYLAWDADGIRDVTFIGFFVVILMASLLLGNRAMFLFTAASVLAGIGLAYLETSGAIETRLDTVNNFARDISFIFILASIFIYLINTSLSNSISRARKAATELAISNEELIAFRNELEVRVEERTAALEDANIQMNRRASLLEAISSVSQAISSIRDIDLLLPRITETISKQFGFYHVGIFLIDEKREFAVLVASNTPGGKTMLENKHRLHVGAQGIVGYVASTGKPRIALDVGDDAIFFDNPYLPETRSEMGLPLRAGNQTIGVLDIQSTESNAFSTEDTITLNALAGQVAISIENTRLFNEAQQALMEAERTIGSRLRDAWMTTTTGRTSLGYRFSDDTLLPISDPTNLQELEKKENTHTVAIPIKLRDQIIGMIDVKLLDDNHSWGKDDLDILHAAADRASIAIETATLLEDTSRRAAFERTTAEISDKISASTRFDAIVRTAAEELSKALGGSEVLVQIQPETFRSKFDDASQNLTTRDES